MDERNPIHIFVAIEEVVSGDVSPPKCTLPSSSRCTIEEIPDVVQEEGNRCVELVPYQRDDPISFCSPNVELANAVDEEEVQNRVVDVENEEQLNGDGTRSDEEQLNGDDFEVVADDNVSFCFQSSCL